MKRAKIAYLILASGLSERFGFEDKLAADLRGRPLINYVLDMSANSGFGKGFIVSRQGTYPGLTTLRNDHPEKGQGYALRLGLTVIADEGWDAACVLLGDMPLIEANHLKKLAETVTPKKSVVSIVGEQKMPPAIFNRQAISKILAGSSSTGAKSIFSQINHRTFPLDPIMSMDVDNEEDLARIEVYVSPNGETGDN